MRASPTRLLKARRSRCSRERKAFLRRYTRRRPVDLGGRFMKDLTARRLIRLWSLWMGVSIEKKANKKVSKRVLDKITWRPI